MEEEKQTKRKCIPYLLVTMSDLCFTPPTQKVQLLTFVRLGKYHKQRKGDDGHSTPNYI